MFITHRHTNKEKKHLIILDYNTIVFNFIVKKSRIPTYYISGYLFFSSEKLMKRSKNLLIKDPVPKNWKLFKLSFTFTENYNNR